MTKKVTLGEIINNLLFTPDMLEEAREGGGYARGKVPMTDLLFRSEITAVSPFGGGAILTNLPHPSPLANCLLRIKMLSVSACIPKVVNDVQSAFENVFNAVRATRAYSPEHIKIPEEGPYREQAESRLINLIDNGERPDILNKDCQDLLRIIAGKNEICFIRKDNKPIAFIAKTDGEYNINYFAETTHSVDQ